MRIKSPKPTKRKDYCTKLVVVVIASNLGPMLLCSRIPPHLTSVRPRVSELRRANSRLTEHQRSSRLQRSQFSESDLAGSSFSCYKNPCSSGLLKE
ncbi:hypothetical protein HanXRQr2_Chr11g0472751 [Helianthus annuus]|uniref:Uncharacterized protein n=2 Tax=Helianthus annuus TaxID=4232 RepID=A0A9K3MYJ4_HELAN|nr:hypothetical protein HanXRQr2_Chr11g0472751 [Helianthus annuus]KAJ0873738.1 hypothetical protein HanPSC8_Chr11g0455901 [Helianthus annuus]